MHAILYIILLSTYLCYIFLLLFTAVRKTNNQIEYLLQLKNGSARNYDSATATKLWPDRLLSFLERNIIWNADDSKNDEVRNTSSGFISVSDAEQINVDKIECKCFFFLKIN